MTSGMSPGAPTSFHLPSPIRASNTAQLRQAVILVLHIILFHRVYGTLRPASVLYLHTEFPVVPEKGVVQAVRRKADELVKRVLSGGVSGGSAELLVSLYDPIASPSGPAGPAPQRPESGGAYRYGWLAHAFAGGIGGPSVEQQSGTHQKDPPTSSPVVPDLGSFKSADERGEPFETWRISFQLVKTRRPSAMRAGGGDELVSSGDADPQVESQLVEFLEQMLRFVDEQRDHVPALPSSEMCPFPIVIDVGHK